MYNVKKQNINVAGLQMVILTIYFLFSTAKIETFNMYYL